MRSVGTEAIILNRHDLGEYDRMITVFSPNLGKIRASVKGARKSGSKFTGHLEPLNICELQLHKSARGYTVIQSQSVKTFRPIRENLKKSLVSMLILEIFQLATHHQEHSRELYDLLTDTLEAVSTGNNNDLIPESFKLKLMKLLGILPELERCCFCRKRWEPDTEIRITEDHQIACGNCRHNLPSKLQIPFNIMKLASYGCNGTYRELARIKTTSAEKNRFKRTADIFLHLYLDREILSEKILMDF